MKEILRREGLANQAVGSGLENEFAARFAFFSPDEKDRQRHEHLILLQGADEIEASFHRVLDDEDGVTMLEKELLR